MANAKQNLKELDALRKKLCSHMKDLEDLRKGIATKRNPPG